MKLIVGLGNPGRKYQGTRHNVGFAVLAELARKYARSRPKSKFHGEVVEADLDGQKALLLGPEIAVPAALRTAVDVKRNGDLIVVDSGHSQPAMVCQRRPPWSAAELPAAGAT